MKATEVAYAELERRELSDVEEPGFEAPREEWKQRSNKRALDVYSKESAKRKVGFHILSHYFLNVLTTVSSDAESHKSPSS